MNNIPLDIRNSMLLGAGIGLTTTAVLFLTVPWYHDLLVWSWTNPWMWVVGVMAGILSYTLDD